MYARLFRQSLAAGAGSSGDFLPPSAPGGKAPLAKTRQALRHRDRARNNLCIELLNRQRQHSLTVNEQFLDELSVTAFEHGLPARMSFLDKKRRRVGPREDSQRHLEGECLRCLPIDHQLTLGRLHDQKVCGLGALENPTGVDAGLPISTGEACAVADQIAGGGVNRALCTSRVSRGGPRAQRAADVG